MAPATIAPIISRSPATLIVTSPVAVESLDSPAALMPLAGDSNTLTPLSSAPAAPPVTVTEREACRAESSITCSPARAVIAASPPSAQATPVGPTTPPAITAPKMSTSLDPRMSMRLPAESVWIAEAL